MAVAGLTIGYVSITLWLIFLVPILGGVAISKSKLGNTTAIAKSMRVQADVQAIKTQLQLYESMNSFYPTTEQGLQALVTQPDKDPRPAWWYQLFKEMPKDPWGNDTFIAALVSKTQAGMTCILPGRIGRLILQTTIGVVVNPASESASILGTRRLRRPSWIPLN